MSEVYRIGQTDGDALACAADFHAVHRPQIESALAVVQSLVVQFPPAAYDHRPWRSAAIADLARKIAPRRINAVAGDDVAIVGRAVTWFNGASGITGQYFALDSVGADMTSGGDHG